MLFRSLVQPALVWLFAHLPSPNDVSVCRGTNALVGDLVECGAGALSVDQCNGLAHTRQTLGPERLLFGNIDPVGVLSEGSTDDVARAVYAGVNAGVNAIWPGCDLFPETPDNNMRALIETANTIRFAV